MARKLKAQIFYANSLGTQDNAERCNNDGVGRPSYDLFVILLYSLLLYSPKSRAVIQSFQSYVVVKQYDKYGLYMLVYFSIYKQRVVSRALGTIVNWGGTGVAHVQNGFGDS